MTSASNIRSEFPTDLLPGENGGMGPSGPAPIVSVRALKKHFGGVYALKGVDLDIWPGQVHGLIGANGAGKSTLIKTLAGLVTSDEGEIHIDGKPTTISNAQFAGSMGLNFIHQELNLVPKFSALQNMMLGLDKKTRFGLIDWRSVRRDAERVAQRIGIRFSLDTLAEDLSVAEQWLVSIGRALIKQARLIVMDEPTASLSAEESETLFRIVRELARDGVAILYVSHRLDEILSLCDAVTAFRDGENAMYAERANLTKQTLIQAIVGNAVENPPEIVAYVTQGPIVLEVRHLQLANAVNDVSFTLHHGEVLGIAGLVGAGRSETVRMIFGADRPDQGEMFLHQQPYRPNSPADAVTHGVALVPEERRTEGLILQKSLSFNANLPTLGATRLFKWLPLVSLGKADARARKIVERLFIKAPDVTAAVGALSGGNQQKVVIGKWLMREPHILILDEPSRGVDIGARVEIHKIIRELAGQGVSVIVISSDNEELPNLCDRVLVMAEGMIVGEVRGAEITKDKLLSLSYTHVTG